MRIIATESDTIRGPMDTQFTTAAHVLGYLAWRDAEGATWVSSEELGHSINTHSVVVRRVLSKLRSSGLIETRRGAGGGSRLARPARKIHLGDAFDAVAEPGASLISFPPEPDVGVCPIGPHIEAVLKEVVAESEARFRRNLEQITIAEFSKRVVHRVNCQE